MVHRPKWNRSKAAHRGNLGTANDTANLHTHSLCLFFRHDGLIIMATNRPYDLDEAMHRRIMIAVEFRQPDHLLRKAIWQSHIPETMKLGEDVDLVQIHIVYHTKLFVCLVIIDTILDTIFKHT